MNTMKKLLRSIITKASHKFRKAVAAMGFEDVKLLF